MISVPPKLRTILEFKQAVLICRVGFGGYNMVNLQGNTIRKDLNIYSNGRYSAVVTKNLTPHYSCRGTEPSN